MHVWGISVDLDSIAPFLFTAFLIVYGLVYVVKNTASKYFVVDASFEAGGVGEESSVRNKVEKEESLFGGKIVVDPVMKVDRFCVVCGEFGSKQCSLCKSVRYCTLKCQKEHWISGGHKNDCGKVVVPNGDRSLQLKKVLFPYDEFVKLYIWNNPGFPPCGLRNCGNSCFANVVLQCLTYTKPLTAYLLEKGHRAECKKAEWCFLCEFETHVNRASRSREPFSPFNILSRLPHIGGNLGFGNQEDAHEFMRFAIDSMQSVFLDQFGGEKALHPSSQETTLIHYIFGGHLLSQVKCISCSKVSNRYENMMDLTVEIHGDNDSLQQCLDQFTTPEWLDGENKYKCDGCNAYVNARKCLSIQQPPNILTIALKRFQSGRFGKLNKRVTFPETLDLSPYMTNAVDGSDVYNLYAVVVHIDMLNASYFGHYICYIKDFCGDWYRIDDCKVVKVDVDEVLSAAAYMLLYCRNRPRESHQMPTEPSKGQEPVEKLESCSTSFRSVAISDSLSTSSSWDTHMPAKPFNGCDNGEMGTKDEATSKYACYGHENGRRDGFSLSDGVGYDNGHSYQGSVSGCSSVSLINGSEHHDQDSVSVARSPSCNFQGYPAEDVNDVTDPMGICDGVGFAQKENGDIVQAEKRPAKRKKDTGAGRGLSDACNMDASKQRKKDGYESLFRRGFLDRNGNKLTKKVNKNITDPPAAESMFKNGNCCSSIADAACSGDSSPKEKLGSDEEEMLCDDVKGHRGIDQEVILPSIDEGHLLTACDLPSGLPDLSSKEKCCSGNDEHELPCNGNYFSADSAECAKDIQIDTAVAPSLPKVEHSPTNGSLEVTCEDSNTDPNCFYADSNECTKNIQIDAKVTPSSPKAEHSSENGSSPEGVCNESTTNHVNASPSDPPSLDGKFCPSVEINREAPASLSDTSSSSVKKISAEQVGNNGVLVTPSTSPSSSGDGLSMSGGGSSFCCNDGKQQ